MLCRYLLAGLVLVAPMAARAGDTSPAPVQLAAFTEVSTNHLTVSELSPDSNLNDDGALVFDLMTAIPPGSTIRTVELTLDLSDYTGSAPLELHRIRQTSGPGPRFVPTVSATVDGGHGDVSTWGPTEALVADVQAWVDETEANHGWALVTSGTELLAAGEVGAVRPRLEVSFTPPVLLIPTLSQAALGMLALLLATTAIAWLALRKDLELPHVKIEIEVNLDE